MFVSMSSVFTDPCITRKRFTRPTYGSTMVLNTSAAGCPSMTVGGGRLVDEEANQAVDADELRRAAAEHGEHGRLRDAARERGGELRRVDRLVVEVALHEVVVADDDALDERVVHRVLFVLHLRRQRAVGSGRRRPVVGDRDVGEELDDSRQRGLFADRELQRRDARTEAVLQLIERA